MAELISGDSALRPIPARTQVVAVAWLRWRMFVNSFLRTKTGKGKMAGLLLTILLRLFIWPIFAVWVIGPVVGCGFLAWLAVSHHHPDHLASLLAGVVIAWQFLSINGLSISANSSSFDPSSLVRFPLPFGRYLFLRTMLGLLTPSTVVGCLALFAAAIGIGIADLGLLLPALVVLAVYALMNIFFTRMLAAWLDRWLATRRAREIFGALMAVLILSVQVVNFRHPGAHSHRGESSWILNLVNGSNEFLRWLPPGYAAHAIAWTAHPIAALAQFIALIAWTALFLAIFAVRLHKQFLGELLSEGAARPSPGTSTAASRRGAPPALPTASSTMLERNRTVFSPIVAACLRKEWIYLRGNANMIIGMLTPLFFVFILSKGLFATHPSYFLPGALGYVLLGLLAPLYNIFGADGAGVQLYLLAPIRLRDVILAKNILSLTLVFAETAVAWILVLLLANTPIPFATHIAAGFWIIFVIGANLSLGTLRSIQAPRKVALNQTRQMRAPTNRTSGLLVVALLLGSILLQIPVTMLCRHFHAPWLATVIFAPLAAAAVITYALLLRNSEQLVRNSRDLFAEELCGV
jgi:ABC-2 type transport system permease protein